MAVITGYCRDCLTRVQAALRANVPKRCPACGSPRMLVHDELESLSIAHIDCDAFFAAVEKLDNPDLRDKPVIVGGGQRGVVSTCCYIARIHGVHSAMPMFTARKLCPDAVIVKPNMQRYVEVGSEIRRRMLALTPLVEPLSIDEAFLDLTGTERLHDGSPALTLLRFAKSIEDEIGVTVSVGLSHNKSMAKMASDMDKPRGFAVIGRAETLDLLAPMPVRALFGVGAAMARSLEKRGYATLADLQAAEPERLWRSFGEHGSRLHDLASGIDPRPVRPNRERKSVSSERTFNEDIADLDALRVIARGASERVAKQLKAKHFSGRTVTLKIKTAAFKTLTRSHSLPTPTQSADRIFRTVEPMLEGVVDGTRFRLLGVGVSELMDAEAADDRDLADADAQRRTEAEKAMDSLRARFGDDAVGVGLVFGQSAPKQAGQSASPQSKDDHSTQAVGRNASKSASTPRNENEP
ncbi:MAG: DNA polymerase IV [Hyphomicrobiales bacterium]